MCKGLIGKKIGMTGIFTPEGDYIPVTVVRIGPCRVTQVKSEVTDGYNALQLGFEENKPSRITKPLKGHFAKSGDKCFSVIKEFAADNPAQYTLGQTLVITDVFNIGDRVDIAGTSKGRGFTGVVKRYGFHGGGQTHGCMSQRVPGSIGASAWPSRVVKGKKMPGHYGNERNTIRNLMIVDIRPEDNIVLLKGAVPGPMSGVVEVIKPKIVKKK
ncbi:MAG: 50S ribosomal protein L3 [Desulfobacteraceae bacterium IS3]|jgi:large subunit ribosomal protein L3|nr:MAG: 50S ribosomal protein L3 [Desulfobacteraceae bacterium IS3]HAO22051.1 50S ribosomal protein L3 [Desulfobacteraceae bacterium]